MNSHLAFRTKRVCVEFIAVDGGRQEKATRLVIRRPFVTCTEVQQGYQATVFLLACLITTHPHPLGSFDTPSISSTSIYNQDGPLIQSLILIEG